MRYFNFWTFLEFPVFLQGTGNLSKYSTFLFFPFSLSFLKREFRQLDSSLNAVILSILHLMLMGKSTQFKSPMLFRPILPTQPCLFLNADFFPASRLLDAGLLQETQPFHVETPLLNGAHVTKVGMAI